LHRLPRALALCSSLVLVAAGPKPSASPSATPFPAAAPVLPSQTPVVLIYPFDVQAGVDPKIGIAIAKIFAREMTAAGGITVPAVPDSVKRPDFLSYARSQHADFYISGYVTPIGDSAAVVEQVVSVQSGVILFSQTAQVTGVADVASQSLQARSQILAYFDRATQSVEPAASNAPAPSATNGAQMQLKGLSGIVASVFHHQGGRATSSPSPSPKPARGVIVVPISGVGSVSGTDLTNASHELYFAMERHFITAMSGPVASVVQSANTICGPHRDNTIASGALAESGKRGRDAVVFTLRVYTCYGAPLATETGRGATLKQAVDAAVGAYATAHPDNS
jgi:hypothetical protein